jgi:hypothetical protein
MEQAPRSDRPRVAHPGLRLFAPRAAARVLALLLGVYGAAFLLLPPPAITVADEDNYVRQAQLILSGSSTVRRVDPFTGGTVEVRPLNEYPLGTALALVPFVAAGGRGAAPLLSLACVVVGVCVTARWLYEQGRSPLWASLVLVYPATVIMGRVAMSEAPSLAVVAAGLWLYWRGLSREGAGFLLAGFLAGFSFAVREANVLLFAAFFVGSALRRDPGWWRLVVGGLLGLSVRFAAAALFFGDPFFVKEPAAFSLEAIPRTLPLYAFSLLVLVPGGLVAALAYRGPRHLELVATVALFAGFHLLYAYSAEESGWAKRLVLGPRYFIPLLPVLAFAAAEVWPRLAARLPAGGRRWGERLLSVALPAAIGLAALALAGGQWVHARWAGGQAVIRDAILANTSDGSVIVSNSRATGKFIDHVYDGRLMLDRDSLQRRHLERLLARGGSFYLVLLDRSDSEFWRRDAVDNLMFLTQVGPARELLVDLQATPTDRLRIWRVGE